MSKIIPTIGRVVWLKDSTKSSQMLSASVSYVHDENCVNLSVSDADGHVSGRTSVPFYHGDAETCPEMMCCWMPYQKAQAEKNEDGDNVTTYPGADGADTGTVGNTTEAADTADLSDAGGDPVIEPGDEIPEGNAESEPGDEIPEGKVDPVVADAAIDPVVAGD